MLAVFVIGRDLKAFACFAANDKEDSECFAGTLLRSWDQGTKSMYKNQTVALYVFLEYED